MANDNVLRMDLGQAPAQGGYAGETSVSAIQLNLDHSAPSEMELPADGFAGNDASSLIVTEMVATPAGADQKRLLLIGVGLICLSLLLALFLFSDDDAGPIAAIASLFSNETPLAPLVKKAQKVTVAQPKQAKIPENPYWNLPNQTLGNTSGTARQWTSAEEAMWRSGMRHKYPYQHYKTVSDIRAYKLRGSEVILWEALSEKKFWTRMQAVLGLADMGIAVDVVGVEKALGNERSSLVDHYFKRFAKAQTEGERFVLRQAIRLVEADARLTILKALATNDEPITHLYLVAATYDPGEAIKPFAEDHLRTLHVPTEKIEAYRNFLTGIATLPADFSAAAESKDRLSADGSEQKSSASEFVSKVEYFQGSAERLNEEGLLDVGSKKLDVIEIK